MEIILKDEVFDAERLMVEIKKAMSDTEWKDEPDKMGFGITFDRVLKCLELAKRESTQIFDESDTMALVNGLMAIFKD